MTDEALKTETPQQQASRELYDAALLATAALCGMSINTGVSERLRKDALALAQRLGTAVDAFRKTHT